jgi:hypothetical protein
MVVQLGLCSVGEEEDKSKQMLVLKWVKGKRNFRVGVAL